MEDKEDSEAKGGKDRMVDKEEGAEETNCSFEHGVIPNNCRPCSSISSSIMFVNWMMCSTLKMLKMTSIWDRCYQKWSAA